jgi:hypothetical protein
MRLEWVRLLAARAPASNQVATRKCPHAFYFMTLAGIFISGLLIELDAQGRRSATVMAVFDCLFLR